MGVIAAERRRFGGWTFEIGEESGSATPGEVGVWLVKAPAGSGLATGHLRSFFFEPAAWPVSERVSLGAAGKRLGVGGGGIRRAGYARLATVRLGAWEHEPPVWLRKAQARKRRSARRAAGWPGAHRIEVSCCVCGTVRQVRPSLVKGYTHLVCGPCGKVGRPPDVPGRPGMVAVRTCNVGGFWDGYTCRIAAAGERAGIVRAAALARAAFLNAAGEPESDG